MASVPVQGKPNLSLRNGCKCVPEPGVTVEELLIVIGEQVGFENIISASRMNKAVVVFLKSDSLVNQLTVSGIWVKETFVTVTPLSAPATKIIISNVPPFISDDTITKELLRFGKIASPVRKIPLGCKNSALKHVLSFRRQVFMFLTSQERTLEVSFRVNHGENSYMVYASTESLKCFECGDLGHKRFMCPHKDDQRASTSHKDVTITDQQTKESDEQRLDGQDKGTTEEGKVQEKKADELNFSKSEVDVSGQQGDQEHECVLEWIMSSSILCKIKHISGAIITLDSLTVRVGNSFVFRIGQSSTKYMFCLSPQKPSGQE